MPRYRLLGSIQSPRAANSALPMSPVPMESDARAPPVDKQAGKPVVGVVMLTKIVALV